MASIRRIKRSILILLNSQQGIALFMVLMAVATLSVLAVEFTYESSVNLKTSHDQFNRLKATYLAKSGLKLSLLRLKAYQKIKGFTQNAGNQGGLAGAAIASAIPRNLIEMLWSVPLPFPIDNVPGLSLSGIQKNRMDKFNEESGLTGGSFVAKIESESNKYNLNLLITPYMVAASPSTTPSANPSASPSVKPNPSASPKLKEEFKPEEARKSLRKYMEDIFRQKMESDDDFATDYQSFILEDLVDNIISWADFTYDGQANQQGDFPIPMKQAPFYSVTELHQLPNMDDTLYDLFAPNFTASRTSGININTMKESVLRAIVPSMNEEEVKKFYEFRDSTEQDNKFRKVEDFFKYLEENVAAYSGQGVKDLQEQLQERNIRLITDEQEFKVNVVATWETATVLIEAIVALEGDPESKKKPTSPNPNDPNSTGQTNAPAINLPPGALPPPAPTGLKIISMRIL